MMERWVDLWLEWLDQWRRLFMPDEGNCPGHVASKRDPKICGICGTHINSLRPEPDHWSTPHGYRGSGYVKDFDDE
jgi:hypothetical protein